MKRHPALMPLSREHHQLLVLAQVLKHDVPAYKNMPATPNEQRAYALERYTDLIEAHFAWEEKVLLPLAERYGDKLQRLVTQVLAEHQALREAFEKLPITPEADLPQELDLLGRALSANVRFEERVLLQKMQELLPETAWISMEQPGRWN
ncbi:hemerythrin domain-containing protein [Lewinella sp. LCG006]|uniref:hemerythrin domain-containing protein n=1 Tax=Lewinella sp. LCG006 TaxID=3231911 RepID=UPI00345F8614